MSALRSRPLDRTKTEHLGVVDRVVWADPDAQRVIVALTDGLAAVGQGDEGQFAAGTRIRFLGRWKDSPKYGAQFAFDTFIADVPPSRKGQIDYLVQYAPNVGKATAEKLCDKYGYEAVRTLRERPELVAHDGVMNLANATEASASLAQIVRLERTKIDLFELLKGRGFPGRLVEAAIAKWGAKAAVVIRRNPFALLTGDLPGAGFKRCDRMWVELGRPKAALKRQMLCGWAALRDGGDGHTWHRGESFVDAVRSAIPGQVDPVKAIKLGLRAGWLRKRRDAGGQLWLAEAEKAIAEERVADRVRVLSAGEVLWPADLPVSETEGDGLPSRHQHDTAMRALASPVGILAGSPGTGKAMPLATMLLTPDGWRAMGRVKVGDEVFGSDGLPHRITGVFPQGELEIFRVTFSDGAAVECCEEHLWFTATRRERKLAQKLGQQPFANGHVRTAGGIRETLLSEDDHTNHYIPLVEPIRFDRREHVIDPYILGVLLGDGHVNKSSVSFTKPDAEIAESVRRLAPAGVSVVKRAYLNRCPAYAMIGGGGPGRRGSERNKTLDEMGRLGLVGKLSQDKFVPDEYKFDCVENRIAILQGLLDTDAHVERCNVEFSTTSRRLADDVRFLVESLGGTVSVAWRVTSYTHAGERRQGRPSARVLVKLPPGIQPFRLERKAAKYIARTKYKPCRQIVSIEPVGRKPAQCISVNSPDSLYVTEHCVLTHNTHTLAFVLRELIREHGLDAVAACAPTGKAAVRMTQSLQRLGLPIRASTIHRLLAIGRNGHDGRGWGFQFNRDNPLPHRFVITDEASMDDTSLLADLLDATTDPTELPAQAEIVVEEGELVPPRCARCNRVLTNPESWATGFGPECVKRVDPSDYRPVAPSPATARVVLPAMPAVSIPGTHVLIIGDPHQLPPVGHGAPLRDLIASGKVAYGELSEIRRNAGLIVEACRDIKGGRPFSSAEKIDLDAGANLKFLETRDETESMRMLETVLRSLTRFDPVWQTQILVAVNKKSRLSREYVNDKVRGWLNPEAGDNPQFAPGDKIICLRNSYVIPHMADPGRVQYGLPIEGPQHYLVAGEEEYLANGETGRVLCRDHQHAIARFREDQPGEELVAKIWLPRPRRDEKFAEEGTAENFDLAYAITVHKAQGSEAPCVIILADPAAGMVADRNHWYTAISRAAKLCLVIGSRGVAEKQCVRVSLVKRKTFLQELLAEVKS